MTMRLTAATSIMLALTLHMAGCDEESPPDERAEAAQTPAGAPPAPSTAPAAMAQSLPGPADRDPKEALAYWRAAMERRDWASARRVFGNFGDASGMTAPEFAAAWDQYRTLDVTVGTGQQEGAAGSSYYEVPVTIAGRTQAGEPYELAGRLTLRRVNDVPGASAEQLRWHIERSTLQP